jgi:hypothetical protein
MIFSTRPLAVALALVAAGGLVACGGGGAKHSATSAVPTPSTPPAVSTPAPPIPSTSSPVVPPKPAAVNPLTGIGPVPSTPLIAVKIDDTGPGRPQLGIDKADVVYIEAVEGGLTRLAAIFGTNKPTVGYVRSTRPSDPELLLQYGKITEAYSGGAHDSLPLVHKSGITSWSNDAGAPYYSRINRSQSSYINLALNLADVAKHVKTPRPKSNGWTFNPSLDGLPITAGTDVRTVVTGSYSSGTPVEFRYDVKLGKYIRYINGVEQFAADGQPVATTNVIVQSCKVVSHPEDTDVNGNPAQFTYTVGTGRVAVFRQGKEIEGSWSRATTADGTTLHTSTGQVLPLDRGNTWVVLIRTGIAVRG